MNIAIYLDGVQSILPGEGKKRDRNYREEKLSAQNKHVISMACRLKQQQGGQMIALMVGKKDNTRLLREALARGCDRGILLEEGEIDSYGFPAAMILGELGLDVVLTGERVLDGKTSYVGPQIAELLNLPYVGSVNHIVDSNKKELIVERTLNSMEERFLVSVPCMLTVHMDEQKEEPLSVTKINEAFQKELLVLERAEWENKLKGWMNLSSIEPLQRIQIHDVREETGSRECEIIDCIPSLERPDAASTEEAVEYLLYRLRRLGVIE